MRTSAQAYQAALGLYQLPTAYMVISASQKDPAEHLAELQELAATPPGPLRHFAINKKLGRHDKALASLVEAGPEHAADARAYAKRHTLLRPLLALLEAQPGLRAEAMGEYAQVCTLACSLCLACSRLAHWYMLTRYWPGVHILEVHAVWSAQGRICKALSIIGNLYTLPFTESCRLQELEERGRQPDAAVAFLACQRQGDAMRCYEAAGDSDMAFALLLRSSPPPAGPAIRRLALSLVDTLTGQGRHEEAGGVAATYLKDAAASARCHCAGGHWRAALAVASQGGNPQVLTDVVAPAAAVAAEERLSEMRTDAARVGKYVERLQLLRAKRAALAAEVGACLEAPWLLGWCCASITHADTIARVHAMLGRCHIKMSTVANIHKSKHTQYSDPRLQASSTMSKSLTSWQTTCLTLSLLRLTCPPTPIAPLQRAPRRRPGRPPRRSEAAAASATGNAMKRSGAARSGRARLRRSSNCARTSARSRHRPRSARRCVSIECSHFCNHPEPSGASHKLSTS